MIDFSHITKTYHTRKNDVRALSNVTLRLPNKGFVALTGTPSCPMDEEDFAAIAQLWDEYNARIDAQYE